MLIPEPRQLSQDDPRPNGHNGSPTVSHGDADATGTSICSGGTNRVSVASLLIGWEEARERGGFVIAEELCRGHPQFIEPLRQGIAEQESMLSFWGITRTMRPDHPRGWRMVEAFRPYRIMYPRMLICR